MEERPDAIMAEFCETERELGQKFLALVNKFKQEMSAGQEKTVRQFFSYVCNYV